MKRIWLVGMGIPACSAILTAIVIFVREKIDPPHSGISEPLYKLYDVYNEFPFVLLAFVMYLFIALLFAAPLGFVVVWFLKLMQRSSFSFPTTAGLLFGKLVLLVLGFYYLVIPGTFWDSRRGISLDLVILSLVSLLIVFLFSLRQLRKIKEGG